MPNSQRDAGQAGSQPKVKPCSECSRLKLKCSRAPWPCHSCRQRNLSHLCPEGQLSTRPYKKRKAAGQLQQPRTTRPAEDVWSATAASDSHSSGDGIEGGAIGEASGSSLRSALAHESTEQGRNIHRYQYDEDHHRSGSRAALPPRSHLTSPPTQGSTGILFLADQALGRPHADRWVSGQQSVPSVGNSSLPRPAPLAHAKSASPTSRSARGNPSTHTTSGFKPPAQDSGTVAPETSKSSSRRASVDAGLLIENEQGSYSFYGPQSHSYNLAQLFAGRASPSLALPPLRGLNGDSSQTTGARGEHSPAAHTKQNSFSPEGSQASSSRRVGLPTSAKRAYREQILKDPASFLVFPGMLSPYGPDFLVQHLSASLPTLRDARRAFGIYRSNAAWLYDPLPSLFSLWEEFYGGAASSPASRRPLRLALLYSVLCVGTLFDVGHPPLRQAELDQACDSYYQLSWAACALSNLLDSSCLEKVQTIQILGQYLCNRANGSKADSFFPLVGMAMRTAVTLGLHRGSALRGCQLSDEELQSRHQAFWELYCHDAFRSLAYGRPCSVQDQHCDTPFPTRGLAKTSLTNVFHEIKYETARILNRVLDLGQRTESPAYSDVLALDRSLRRLWGRLPTRFRSTAGRASLEAVQDIDDESYEFLHNQSAESEIQVFLQGNTAIANISQSLLHLHRPWFVRALRSKKSSDRSRESDILDSPYARSVVAVSESSRSLIDVAQSVLESTPTLSKAMNFFWHHCFNAAVCQCLHTLQEPSSVSALGAWDDARRAISILRRARPDRSDVVWAGKLELLEALQTKTEERLTSTTQDGRTTDKADSGQASIAEHHLPLVGGGSAISGASRKKQAQARGPAGASGKPPGLTQGNLSSSYDSGHSGTAPSISPLTEHAGIHSMTSPMSITTATSHADEWLNTLSDDLAGFLTSRQRQQRPEQQMDAPSHQASLDIAGWQHQANEWSNAGNGEEMNSSASASASASAATPQFGHPIPQHQATTPHQAQQQQQQHSAQTPSAIEPSQSWNTLLADLLQVGCEPDTNFWAAIARDGR